MRTTLYDQTKFSEEELFTSKTDWKTLEDRFDERVAALRELSCYSTYHAENLAAQLEGFMNKPHLKSFIQQLKAKETNYV